MGVLSDLILATEADARAVAETDSALRPWPWVDVKGIEHVKLGRLNAILTGEAFNQDFVRSMDRLAAEDPDSGPWVFRLPRDFVHRLAAVDDNRQRKVASLWAQSEEFVADTWGIDDVLAVLRAIIGLAQRARDSGPSLLLWMSL